MKHPNSRPPFSLPTPLPIVDDREPISGYLVLSLPHSYREGDTIIEKFTVTTSTGHSVTWKRAKPYPIQVGDGDCVSFSLEPKVPV